MGKALSLLVLIVLASLTVECDKRTSELRGILVSTDWLQGQMKDPSIIVLHSGTEEGYDTLHIPGARLIIPRDFAVSNDSMTNELPAMDSVVNMLKRAGVNKDSRIVLCYEDAEIIRWTTRVFLTLEYAGLADHTYVLNGGLPAWLEEERETTALATDISLGNLEAMAPVEVIISTNDLERERWSPEVMVVDARSDEDYRGTTATEEEEAEGGHIEGAYSLPYQTKFLEENSYMFKSDTDLEQTFRDLELDRSKTTIVYCNSGIRASVNYLVARHLGYPVLLYDGSYQEWERLDMPMIGPVDLPEENE